MRKCGTGIRRKPCEIRGYAKLLTSAKSFHIRYFNGLDLAKIVCESPSFARIFAKRRRDIRLRHSHPRENFIADFDRRSAAIRLMLHFCSSQPHRPDIVTAFSVGLERRGGIRIRTGVPSYPNRTQVTNLRSVQRRPSAPTSGEPAYPSSQDASKKDWLDINRHEFHRPRSSYGLSTSRRSRGPIQRPQWPRRTSVRSSQSQIR